MKNVKQYFIYFIKFPKFKLYLQFVFLVFIFFVFAFSSSISKPSIVLAAGACPTGGYYCGNDGLGANSSTLYYCTGSGATPQVSQNCSNGCKINPPGVSDQCNATPSGPCPTSGNYCGGSVGQNANNLYSCSGAGANPVLSQTCSNGCHVNPPGTPDQCNAAPSGPCPTAGDYCGGSVGQNSNNLYNCLGSGANPTLKQTCSANGCQVNPQGTNDVCKPSGACPTSGNYCGGSVGQNANNLYSCSGVGANPVLSQTCSNGCQVNPPGTADVCKATPVGPCPTSGNYCGGSVGQNINNLYSCLGAGANPVLSQTCSNGCQVNPSGTADICKAPPLGPCPTAGNYCGVSVGQNTNNLYSCSSVGAFPTLNTSCSNGCHVNPPGTADICNAPVNTPTSCPTSGNYCGSSVGQNTNNLYSCSGAGATAQLKQTCSNGCHINPPGTADVCNGTTSTTCPNGNGLYCGGPAGLNPNNLYQCTNGVYQLSSACSNGCQINSAGVADLCLNPTGGASPDNNQVGDNQLISTTLSHLAWPFSLGSSYANKSPWVLTGGSGGTAHWDSDYFAQDWAANGGDAATCNQDFISPVKGTVIFAGCIPTPENPNGDPNGNCNTADYGKQVIVQLNDNSNFAFRIAHLNSVNVSAGSTVNKGSSKLGQVGNTGKPYGTAFNCHAHISFYQNINTAVNEKTTTPTGLDKLKSGQGLGLVTGKLANKFADNFRLDAVTAKSDQFSFPLQNISDFKVELGFRFGSGPIYTWKKCNGELTYNTGSRIYHSGVDLIGKNAKGTEEVFNSSDIDLCKAGSLGAQVLAVGDGIISESNTNAGDGGRVTIKHTLSNGQVVYSVYMHINIASGIVKDNPISRGTIIGTVGNYSNNPHLHFEMRNFPNWDYGYTDSWDPTTKGYFDPCDFINQHGGAVPSTCSNVHPAGGQITAFNSDIVLTFPQDATNQDLLVGIYRNTTTVGTTGYSLVSNPYQLTALSMGGTEVTNFSRDIAIQLSYDPDILLGRSEDNLSIAYFNTGLNQWINLPSIVDKVKKIITALTPHFSQYAVLIPNSPPVVTQIPAQTIQNGQSFTTINLGSYVSDPNSGDTLTWSYSGNTNITISINNNVATLTYPGTWSGTENITFKATDVAGASASSITIFKVNATTIAGTELLSSPWHLTGNNGASELYQSIGTSVLAGKTTLRITYDLHGLTALGADASAIIFDQNGWKYISLSNYGVNGKNGTQTVDIPLSAFTSLNLSTGSNTIHTRFWYGSAFTVDIYSIQVLGPSGSNNPPTITSTPVTTVNENAAYTYDVNATDLENNTLTYSLTQGKTGMTINSSTGVISWTPTYNDSGTYTIIVTVSDGTNNVTQSYNLVVINVNRAPVVTQIPGQTIAKGQTFTTINLATYGSDSDANPITWSIFGNTNISVNISSNIVTLTYLSSWVGGTENITFKAMDSLGASATSTAAFIVNPVSVGTELLTTPWHLTSNNGASELYQTISTSVLAGKTTLRITYDLHGLNALGGDASAIIFDQNGWQYISLSNYGVNGKNGIQTVDIPLSAFTGLNLVTGSTTIHTRFWYGSAFTVDINSIKIF